MIKDSLFYHDLPSSSIFNSPSLSAIWGGAKILTVKSSLIFAFIKFITLNYLAETNIFLLTGFQAI